RKEITLWDKYNLRVFHSSCRIGISSAFQHRDITEELTWSIQAGNKFFPFAIYLPGFYFALVYKEYCIGSIGFMIKGFFFLVISCFKISNKALRQTKLFCFINELNQSA